MDLTVTKHGPATLWLAGLPKTFDYTVCPDFQRCLAPLIEAAPKVLVVDLSGVDFMDSSAIGSLITVRNRLLPEGGEPVALLLHLRRRGQGAAHRRFGQGFRPFCRREGRPGRKRLLTPRSWQCSSATRRAAPGRTNGLRRAARRVLYLPTACRMALDPCYPWLNAGAVRWLCRALTPGMTGFEWGGRAQHGSFTPGAWPG